MIPPAKSASRKAGATLLACLALALAPQARAQSADDDIVAVEKVFGPADGFPTEYSPDYVRQFNAGVREGAANTIRERRPEISPDTVKAETDVIQVTGRSVMRTRVELPPSMFFVQYAGVVRGNVVVVVCTKPSGRIFDPAGTACERQVQRTFAP